MIDQLNETHNLGCESWVPSAQEADTDFPLQNLPFAIFRRRGTNEPRRVGVAIGSAIPAKCLHSAREAEFFVPARIGDYTDFFASIHHATNCGRLLRLDTPLPPNYKYVPIAYHGRASSIVVSRTDIRRPNGQRHAGQGDPTFGASQRLDCSPAARFPRRNPTAGEACWN